MRGDLAGVAALPMGTFMMATPVILQGECQIIARLLRSGGSGRCYVLGLMDMPDAVKIAAIQDKIATVAAR